jgi:hypothetical protein
MTTTAPRWVTLDELVSQEVRDEMATLTRRLQTQVVTLEDELLAEVLDQRWHDETAARTASGTLTPSSRSWSGLATTSSTTHASRRACTRTPCRSVQPSSPANQAKEANGPRLRSGPCRESTVQAPTGGSRG